MNRRHVRIALTGILAAITLACASPEKDSAPVPPMAGVPENNPGHFVPSDVARLAATGRPQMVEVFHYG